MSPFNLHLLFCPSSFSSFFRVLEVEFSHSDGKALKAIMQKAGYTFKRRIGEDWIFVKNGYQP